MDWFAWPSSTRPSRQPHRDVRARASYGTHYSSSLGDEIQTSAGGVSQSCATGVAIKRLTRQLKETFQKQLNRHSSPLIESGRGWSPPGHSARLQLCFAEGKHMARDMESLSRQTRHQQQVLLEIKLIDYSSPERSLSLLRVESFFCVCVFKKALRK